MYFTCPKCHSPRYLLIDILLVDNDHYQKITRCRRCHHEWKNTLSLLSTTNQYQFLWLPSTKKIVQLHRWVWEQKYNCKLTNVDAIHHKNHTKGDNRVYNLAKMNRYSHNGYFHIAALLCYKCYHEWLPKCFIPRYCPKCKTPNWNQPERFTANTKDKATNLHI